MEKILEVFEHEGVFLVNNEVVRIRNLPGEVKSIILAYLMRKNTELG